MVAVTLAAVLAAGVLVYCCSEAAGLQAHSDSCRLRRH